MEGIIRDNYDEEAVLRTIDLKMEIEKKSS